MMIKKPHKHAELIKAWADGEQIQFRSNPDASWKDVDSPKWDVTTEYQIKLAPKEISIYGRISNLSYIKPNESLTHDYEKHGSCFDNSDVISGRFSEKNWGSINNLELVFDSLTGILIKANILR